MTVVVSNKQRSHALLSHNLWTPDLAVMFYDRVALLNWCNMIPNQLINGNNVPVNIATYHRYNRSDLSCIAGSQRGHVE